jgi:hypothetical protein
MENIILQEQLLLRFFIKGYSYERRKCTPFIVDDTTAKIKQLSLLYLITGITKDTYIMIDVYDQNNTKPLRDF